MSVDNMFSSAEVEAMKQGMPLSKQLTDKGDHVEASEAVPYVAPSDALEPVQERPHGAPTISGPKTKKIDSFRMEGVPEQAEKVVGPTPDSVIKAAQEQAKVQLAIEEQMAKEREEKEATRPDKLVARLSYLERQVKSLSNKLTKLTKELKK